MLALLLQGALSQRATPTAGLWTLIDGVVLAGVLQFTDINFYYIAFIGFCYSMLALWLLSFHPPITDGQTGKLTYRPFLRGVLMIQWLQSMPAEWGNYASMLLFVAVLVWLIPVNKITRVLLHLRNGKTSACGQRC